MMQLINDIPASSLFYFFLGCLLFLVMLAYILMARRFGIIDYPNERSSHKHPTISSAGVLFPFAVLLWFILSGMQDALIVFALLLLSVLSFLDDIRHVNAKLRILFHFIAAAMLMLATSFVSQQWYAVLPAYLLVFGYINAGNFMDGINGMTAFFHIVTFGSFILLEQIAMINPFTPEFMEIPGQVPILFPQGLVNILFISMLVFTFFNARKKALVFAGDAGSISLSFIVAWLLIELMLATGNYYWILFIATYGIDTVYTMIARLRQGQKPLEAHRTHLHHLLIDVAKYPQLKVSAAYAITQIIINAFTIWMISTGNMNMITFLLTLLAVIVVYALFREKVVKLERRASMPE